MKIVALRTEKIRARSTTITALLDRCLKKFPDRSILVITSKIVALCEGRILDRGTKIDETVIEREAEYYLPKEHSRYGIPLTITDNAFIARAGIDASNTDGQPSLLPKDSYRAAKRIRTYLTTRFGVTSVGVIIVDSHSTPLRRGTTGIAIGWSGFRGLKAYDNVPDIFGDHFTTHQNHVDALAAAAVLCIGEGNEQTPLALITDINTFIHFSPNSPTKKELAYFKPYPEEDLFAPLLNFKNLKKGKRKNR